MRGECMLYLTVRHGGHRGICWPLTQTPVIIGRGEDCTIRIVDGLISRKHCQVWVEGEVVLVEDLGSRNATLVNGRPIQRAQLALGDELAVGPARFEVTQERPAPQGYIATDEPTPITLALQRGMYTCDATTRRLLRANPRTVHELYELFCLGRDLADITTLRALAETTEAAVRRLLEPALLWGAWYRVSDNKLIHWPLDEASTELPAPEELMRKAIAEQQGLLAPHALGESGSRQFETTLALPLIHGKVCVGCIALAGRTPGRIYSEDDLEYALGLAATVAPHVRAIEQLEQLARDHQRLRDAVGVSQQLLGDSPVMRDARSLIRRAAESHLSVLILGETGTGKELAARMLHDLSPRKEGPYVVLNCAAIPRELFESEMFGHERGAFTGATDRRIGRMEEAHGGTLFLDEIGDLAPEHQARILRAIEHGTFRRLGGKKDVRVDVRFVAATNRALGEDRFRLDLYHRLNGFTVQMPPLRSHPTDIENIALAFLQAGSRSVDHRVRQISPEAVRHLETHAWPGNVRELRATIERAALFCNGETLKPEHLPITMAATTSEPTPMLSLAEVERRHVLTTLQACNGNISATARTLQINRVTLYKRLAEYGA